MVALTKTTKPILGAAIKHEWHLIDVENQVLGRSANAIAKLLQGKHKVNYVPYLDNGDYVVVINAAKVTISGNKAETKSYSYYSGYPGGMKDVSYKQFMERKPTEIIKHAISGMLPKNKLRDRRLARLYIYGGSEHPYLDKVQK